MAPSMNREQRRQQARSWKPKSRREIKRLRNPSKPAAKNSGAAPAAPPEPAFRTVARTAATAGGSAILWVVVAGVTRVIYFPGAAIVGLLIMAAVAGGTTFVSIRWARSNFAGLVGFIAYSAVELIYSKTFYLSGPESAWWPYFFLPVALFYVSAIVFFGRRRKTK